VFRRRAGPRAELPKLLRPLQWVAINPGLVLEPLLDKDSSASVQIVRPAPQENMFKFYQMDITVAAGYP